MLRRGRLAAWGVVHPALAPALCLVAGVLAAPSAARVPIGAACCLVALGCAWGRGAGRALSALALGLALGWVRLGAPALDDPPIDPARPVSALVRPLTHFRPTEGGWSAPARILSLRQGPRVALAARTVWLSVAAERAPAHGDLWARGQLRLGEAPANDVPGPRSPDRLQVKSARLLEPRAEPRELWPRFRLGHWARRRLERPDAAPLGSGERLALALVLGESWRLDDEIVAALRVWGLAHLTAASGLHVGMVALAFAGACAWDSGGRRWAIPALAVALYCGLVGARPSLLRAVAMLALASLARRRRLPGSAIDGLAVALASLVLAEPAVASDLGFRLSFAATGGIVAYGSRLRRAWSALPGWLATPLSVAVSAQLFTAPLTVGTFWSLPLLAPLLNLVFVPWTGCALLAGFVWVGGRLAGLPIGGGGMEALVSPYEALARLPVPGWAVVPMAVGLPELLAGTGLAAWLLTRPRLSAVAAAVVAAACWWGPRPPATPELWMLDVGQGDAFLLRSDRRVALIDGGGWRRGDFAARVLLPSLARLGVRRIDLAILSHADVDHCGGLRDLAARVPIGELWHGGVGGSGCGDALLARLGRRARRVEEGTRAEVGVWRLEVGPRADGNGDDNRGSLVVRASAPGGSVLFTGDLDAAAESMLRRSGFPLRADVLKVAHHGSRTSTERRFLRAVAPRVALVSAGRGNPYGHPSSEVTARLARHGASVWRTDLDGRVALRFPPGGPIRIEVERARTWRDGAPLFERTGHRRAQP